MASATTALLGAGMSVFQLTQGEKMRKNAQNELNDYERVELENAFENMPISTVGSELMREETQRATATAVDAARNAGMRGIFGTIPGIVAANNDANRQAQKYLDDQVIDRNYAIANDNVRIQRMREQRDYANIGALSEQVQAGRQDVWSGIRGLGASAIYAANNIDWTGEGSQAEQDAKAGVVRQPIFPGANYPMPANDQMYNPWNFNPGF